MSSQSTSESEERARGREGVWWVRVGGGSEWGKREREGEKRGGGIWRLYPLIHLSRSSLLLLLLLHTLSLHMHTQQAPPLSPSSPLSPLSLSRSSSLPPHPSPVLASSTPLLAPLPGTPSAAQRAGWGCCDIAVPNAQAPLVLLPRVAPRRESPAGECEKGEVGGANTQDRRHSKGEGGRRKREREREKWEERDPCSSIRLEASGDYPLNLSISLSGGKEINRDLPSSGERTGVSPTLNRGSIHVGREMWGKGLPAPREHAPHFTNQSAGARRPRVPHHRG